MTTTRPFPRCFTIVTFAVSFILPGTVLAESPHAPQERFPQVEQHRLESAHGIVAADHRYASEAGAEILAQGGNAADAGVVAMLVLGITHPFASGLGGGGFCLYHEAEVGETTVLDFREIAPAKAHRDLYAVDGEVDHGLARRGGLAVATPGEPAGLWSLHGRFGHLPWEDLFEGPRRLAEQGFPVGATLAEAIEQRADDFVDFPELAAVFQDEQGTYLTEGDLLVRDDLVRALEVLETHGVHPFYAGEVAQAIAQAAQAQGGILTVDDLAAYRLERRKPIVGEFRGMEIHSMPPPSSGGIALIQALNLLEALDLPENLDDPLTLHLMVEALKHAFADRARWLGDTDFVDVPVEKLISREYAQELAQRVDLDQVLETEEYGTIAPDPEAAGTAHLSVVDAQDNLLACTTTINTRFGSMVYVPEFGLILNNEMADFNVEPGEPNIFGLIGNEQNAVAAGKRPLSSMSPTLLLRDGVPWMTLGASGGPTIITGTYLTLLRTLVYGEDLLDAITAPRLHHQWIPETLFVETEPFPGADHLTERGHSLSHRRAYNAVQAILRGDGHWIGVSDPRKGGVPAAPAAPPE